MIGPAPHSGPQSDIAGLPAGWSARRLDRSRRGGDFQGIYLLATDSRRMVLKLFGPKGGKLRRAMLRIDHVLTGRSAPDLRTRWRTEKKALDEWRRNGFDVFRQPEDPPAIDLPVPYLAFEYVDGPTLKNFFRDREMSPDAKLEVLSRFLPQWGHRHLEALRRSNRYLIQEHASFKHVLLGNDGRLITFDLEEIFTERHPLPFLIGREIAGYLRSLYRVAAPGEFERYLETIVQGYRPTEFLSLPHRYFFRHPNPVLRPYYSLVRRLPANRRRDSRYGVISRLQAALGQRI